jgi:hypothetical protein
MRYSYPTLVVTIYPTWTLGRFRGTKRQRRDLDAVRDDVLLAWLESQDVVRIEAKPEADDLATGSTINITCLG